MMDTVDGEKLEPVLNGENGVQDNNSLLKSSSLFSFKNVSYNKDEYENEALDLRTVKDSHQNEHCEIEQTQISLPFSNDVENCLNASESMEGKIDEENGDGNKRMLSQTKKQKTVQKPTKKEKPGSLENKETKESAIKSPKTSPKLSKEPKSRVVKRKVNIPEVETNIDTVNANKRSPKSRKQSPKQQKNVEICTSEASDATVINGDDPALRASEKPLHCTASSRIRKTQNSKASKIQDDESTKSTLDKKKVDQKSGEADKKPQKRGRKKKEDSVENKMAKPVLDDQKSEVLKSSSKKLTNETDLHSVKNTEKKENDEIQDEHTQHRLQKSLSKKRTDTGNEQLSLPTCPDGKIVEKVNDESHQETFDVEDQKCEEKKSLSQKTSIEEHVSKPRTELEAESECPNEHFLNKPGTDNLKSVNKKNRGGNSATNDLSLNITKNVIAKEKDETKNVDVPQSSPIDSIKTKTKKIPPKKKTHAAQQLSATGENINLKKEDIHEKITETPRCKEEKTEEMKTVKKKMSPQESSKRLMKEKEGSTDDSENVKSVNKRSTKKKNSELFTSSDSIDEILESVASVGNTIDLAEKPKKRTYKKKQNSNSEHTDKDTTESDVKPHECDDHTEGNLPDENSEVEKCSLVDSTIQQVKKKRQYNKKKKEANQASTSVAPEDNVKNNATETKAKSKYSKKTKLDTCSKTVTENVSVAVVNGDLQKQAHGTDSVINSPNTGLEDESVENQTLELCSLGHKTQPTSNTTTCKKESNSESMEKNSPVKRTNAKKRLKSDKSPDNCKQKKAPDFVSKPKKKKKSEIECKTSNNETAKQPECSNLPKVDLETLVESSSSDCKENKEPDSVDSKASSANKTRLDSLNTTEQKNSPKLSDKSQTNAEGSEHVTKGNCETQIAHDFTDALSDTSGDISDLSTQMEDIFDIVLHQQSEHSEDKCTQDTVKDRELAEPKTEQKSSLDTCEQVDQKSVLNLKNENETNLDELLDSQGIKCPNCDHISKSGGGHAKHVKKCNPNGLNCTTEERKIFTCEHCDFTSQRRAPLIKHLTSHNIYICGRCKKKFENSEALKEHTIEIHGDKRHFKLCRVCKRFVKCDEVPLEEHMKDCKGPKPFLCEVCNKEFKFESFLQTHMNKHFPDRPKQFSCDECKYKTNYRANLAKHIATMHRERKKTIQCPECGKLFYSEQKLLKHQKIHSDDKPFVCDICGKSFKVDRYLTLHKETHLPNTNPVKCNIEDCGKEFKNTRLLKTHQNLIHIKRDKAEPNIICPVEGCSQTFMKKCHFNRHIVTHTGERNYICSWNECGKSFRHRDNLKVHIMQHTNERPVKCKHCDFKCRQKSSLEWHIKKRHPHLYKGKKSKTNVKSTDNSALSQSTDSNDTETKKSVVDLYEFRSDDESFSASPLVFKKDDSLKVLQNKEAVLKDSVTEDSLSQVNSEKQLSNVNNENPVHIAEPAGDFEGDKKSPISCFSNPIPKLKESSDSEEDICKQESKPIKKRGRKPGKRLQKKTLPDNESDSEDNKKPVKKRRRKKNENTATVTEASVKKDVMEEVSKSVTPQPSEQVAVATIEQSITTSELAESMEANVNPSEPVGTGEEASIAIVNNSSPVSQSNPTDTKLFDLLDRASPVVSDDGMPEAEIPETVSSMPTEKEKVEITDVTDEQVIKEETNMDMQAESNADPKVESPSPSDIPSVKQESVDILEETPADSLSKEEPQTPELDQSILPEMHNSDVEEQFVADGVKLEPNTKECSLRQSDGPQSPPSPMTEIAQHIRSPEQSAPTDEMEQTEIQYPALNQEYDEPREDDYSQPQVSTPCDAEHLQQYAVDMSLNHSVVTPGSHHSHSVVTPGSHHMLDSEPGIPSSPLDEQPQETTEATEPSHYPPPTPPDKDFLGQYLQELDGGHHLRQEVPSDPPEREGTDERSSQFDGMRGDKDYPSVSSVPSTPLSLPPPYQSDLSYKRLEILATDRQQEGSNTQTRDNQPQRLPDSVYDSFSALNSFHNMPRDAGLFRQPESLLGVSAAGSSFMRLSESDPLLQRQRMTSPFMSQTERNIHRIPENSVPRVTDPSLLRRSTMPTRENVFAPSAMPQTMVRNPFHTPWPPQDVRPPHWPQSPYLPRQGTTATPALFSKDNYLTGRDFMFDPSCRPVTDRNMFVPLSSAQSQREFSHDTFQLDRFDLSNYFSSHGYPGSSALDYGRTASSTQKAFDDRYRQTASADFRTLPQTSTADVLGSISVNSSFNLDKYMYPRDPVYHPQHPITDNTNNPFLSHTTPTQHAMFDRSFYQNTPYPFIENRQYAASAKLTHTAAGVGQDRDIMARPNPAENQLQDPYRSGMLYNMMNRYFE